MPLHVDTPLVESFPLSLVTGRSVWLKLDALQPPGSFKIRGIGAACERHVGAGKRRFVSSSGGNAGIAVAYAGRRLSVPVVVVVPETTTEAAKALIRQQGADLVVHGASWQEANGHAFSLVDNATAFLHPFDHPWLWDGHATLIDEVVRAGCQFDCVLLSVGGGGLLAGVVEGLVRNGLEDPRSSPSRRRARRPWRNPSRLVIASNCRPSPASRPRSGPKWCASRRSTWHGATR